MDHQLFYLVFLKIVPNGLKENEANNFWQVFAFQYTSSSVDIKIETEDNEIIAGGKYTNKNVFVSWKQPGIFDRAIKGFYYRVTNKNASREELLAGMKRSLSVEEVVFGGEKYFQAYLGQDVADGSFGKYLIRLESEGESATHKIFTIDHIVLHQSQEYHMKHHSVLFPPNFLSVWHTW